MIKFSDYFTSPAKRSSAIRSGLFLGFGVFLMTDWRYGILCGAIATLIFSLVSPVISYLRDLPYIKLKRTLPQPFLFDEPVRFTVKGGMVNGFFVLTAKSMVFLSRGDTGERMELTREDVKSVVLESNAYALRIFLDGTRFVMLYSAVCEQMSEVLRENGWNVQG